MYMYFIYLTYIKTLLGIIRDDNLCIRNRNSLFSGKKGLISSSSSLWQKIESNFLAQADTRNNWTEKWLRKRPEKVEVVKYLQSQREGRRATSRGVEIGRLRPQSRGRKSAPRTRLLVCDTGMQPFRNSFMQELKDAIEITSTHQS